MKFGTGTTVRRRRRSSSSSSSSSSSLHFTMMIGMSVSLLLLMISVFQRTNVVTAAIAVDVSSSLKPGEVVVPDDGPTAVEPNEDVDVDVDEDEDEDDEEDEIINTHVRVMMWLENRALYAENNFYMHPWEDEDDDEEYQYQNGYFFSHQNLKLDIASGKGAVVAAAPPRIVARQDIPEGTLLVSVPSNTFLYKTRDESKRSNQQLHPCDVATKIIDVEETSYLDSKLKRRPLPGNEKFVQPFIDSILKLYDTDTETETETENKDGDDGETETDTDTTDTEHQLLWSDKQIDILSKILGNELEPKSNTLGLFQRSKSKSNNNNSDEATTTTFVNRSLCETPTSDQQQVKKYHYSYNPTKHPISKLNLFRNALHAVITKGWNSRMVPIYHWIPRSSDQQHDTNDNDQNKTTTATLVANVRHSVIEIDESTMYDYVIEEREIIIKRQTESLSRNGQSYIEPWVEPTSYQLHSSRTIKKGEILVLPYHSIAQQFISTGGGKSTVSKSDGKTVSSAGGESAPIRFWTQTLHDQTGTDNKYDKNRLDPYESFLSWDYYPATGTGSSSDDTTKSSSSSSSRIVWIDNYDEKPIFAQEQEQILLRDTQRNILHSQYMRLRQMENEVQQQLLLSINDDDDDDDDDAAGNRAIYEYYQLWTDSLGLILAHSRPQRNNGLSSSSTTTTTTCSNNNDNNDDDDVTCSAADDDDDDTVTSTTLSSLSLPPSRYDDLKVRRNGDGINYNGVTLAHDCTNKFEQTLYEETNTPYANLEWTRSYIGGGRLINGGNDDDDSNNSNDEREQDTCLHLNGVLHSCLAFRPHVHETLIHYPASFLPKDSLKRVLFVGGGDLVILHEILRYPSVELVIGMELDQTVLRSSFRHYGIQPNFEDERVHWWFGDGSKSLTMLPPEEYFGTFDLVLIDLVCEIFDSLRVGDHNERLVDYMMKLLKPEGILVRQEDWAEHNVVDFAKHTVDLNVFGMPHSCSQFFTMGSNGIDFANHERVDHGLEDLIWYEPSVDDNNHTLIWGNYRNNLDPPDRICLQNDDGEGSITDEFFTENKTREATNNDASRSSVGIFVAIEAENVTIDLDDDSLVVNTVKKALDEIGFVDTELNDNSFNSTFNSFVFIFEEGYLAMRMWSEDKYCSMDLQLWNTIANHERAVSKLVTAVGGNIEAGSTSSFLITTGGMFGIRNNLHDDKRSNEIIPSSWCSQDDSDNESSDKTDDGSTIESTPSQLQGLDNVISEMLSSFFTKINPTVIVLCPNKSSSCRALEDVDYGQAQIIPLHACPDIIGGDDSSLGRCEQEIMQKIRDMFSLSKNAEKIEAMVIDSETPRELGQIVNRISVNGASSFQWLSHDYVVLVPSPTTSTLDKIHDTSWRYQFLERFRTDAVEFNPVYHATIAFTALSSSSNWNIGVLRAGDSRFYDQLIESMNKIRRTVDFEDVSLLESKTGVISHIPDYQPSKWATPSDYDIQPATKQWSEQRPLGRQLLAQYEKLPTLPDDISVGPNVLIYRELWDDWCIGSVYDIWEKAKDEQQYTVRCDGMEASSIDVGRNLLAKLNDEMQTKNTIPFGSIVIADGEEKVHLRIWYEAQIIGMNDEGKYKVYYLGSGEISFLYRRQIIQSPGTYLSSLSTDVKAFSTCADFEQFLFDSKILPTNRVDISNQKVGDGCVVLVSFSSAKREGGDSTTIIVTYDGRKHIDLNVYSPENASVNIANELALRDDIPGFKRIQNDSHPRGYGRVVTFEEDLRKPYFGTKYPTSIE